MTSKKMLLTSSKDADSGPTATSAGVMAGQTTTERCIATMNDASLMIEADRRAAAYVASVSERPPYPDQIALANLAEFDEPYPEQGRSSLDTLDLLDRIGSPATAVTTGPRYFGYVVGGVLPAAAASERMVLAWDQRASTFASSPVSATVEKVAGRWILDALALPKGSAVGFGTSATACTIACLSAARRALLARRGWDWDRDGAVGAPPVRVVASATIHIAVSKALRILGFGLRNVVPAPVDPFGRVDPKRLPELDARTILCLQAGEVNSGAFDPFVDLLPRAAAAGAWTHIDGAFGLWARASSSASLCEGIDAADSWTADGHKWLNTPYDSAFAICRDAEALEAAMSSDAVYAPSEPGAQQNLTLEFSRRARGIPIWAALRTLGRNGLREMVDRNIAQAKEIGEALVSIGYTLPTPVVLNQVLARASDDLKTARVCEFMQSSGAGWFGMTRWNGRAAFRISVCSHRTNHEHVTRLIAALEDALNRVE
jgi:glutamate/tyrosine decarboxylase-like PLP-dependent enzyme